MSQSAAERELKSLATLIDQDETLVRAAVCRWGERKTLLFVTDRRIVLTVRKERPTNVPFDDVRAVRFSSTDARLAIFRAEADPLVLDEFVPPEAAPQLRVLLDAAVREAQRRPVDPGPPGVVRVDASTGMPPPPPEGVEVFKYPPSSGGIEGPRASASRSDEEDEGPIWAVAEIGAQVVVVHGVAMFGAVAAVVGELASELDL